MRPRSESRASQLVLQGRHATFELQHLHVQGGLLTAEGSNLLLEARILLLLVRKVPLDVFLDLEELVGEGLSDVLGLKSEVLLEGGLLGGDRLHLRAVVGKLLLQRLDHFLQPKRGSR